MTKYTERPPPQHVRPSRTHCGPSQHERRPARICFKACSSQISRMPSSARKASKDKPIVPYFFCSIATALPHSFESQFNVLCVCLLRFFDEPVKQNRAPKDLAEKYPANLPVCKVATYFPQPLPRLRQYGIPMGQPNSTFCNAALLGKYKLLCQVWHTSSSSTGNWNVKSHCCLGIARGGVRRILEVFTVNIRIRKILGRSFRRCEGRSR